jgi:putative AlgH/UPF0301 family transcriptional regulator
MIKQIAKLTGAVVVIAALVLGVARAAERSDAVILVASQDLDGSPLEQTVVIAASLPNGGHAGFIVNRPTSVKLETLFPDQAPARNVKEPVYVGGPAIASGVFVLMRTAPNGAEKPIFLAPGIVAVLDESTIDRVIENTPNAARYFVGMMLWDADELEQEIADGLWEVRPADADSVLPAKVRGLWNALRSPMTSIGGPSLG